MGQLDKKKKKSTRRCFSFLVPSTKEGDDWATETYAGASAGSDSIIIFALLRNSGPFSSYALIRTSA